MLVVWWNISPDNIYIYFYYKDLEPFIEYSLEWAEKKTVQKLFFKSSEKLLYRETINFVLKK